MTKKVIIIGAGMGGLSAALSLSANTNADILVLEAAENSGGKVGFCEHDGVRFDTGPSLFTLPEVLAALLDDAGRRLEEELTLFRPDPVFRYRFADGTDIDVAPTLDETTSNISRVLGADAARQFEDFLAYTRRIWEAAAPNFVMGAAPTMLSTVKMGFTALRQLRDIDPGSTMIDAIDKRISNSKLRDIFLRYATFNGSDPRQAPATLNCISWVDMGIGGRGIEGGMRMLASTLERIAVEEGAQFNFETRVDAIDRRGDGYLVSAGDQTWEADAVVVNADIRHLSQDLWSSEVDHGLKTDAELSTSGWTAVLKARRRTVGERPAHSVSFPERDYLQEFVDLFDGDQPPEEPTLYLCAQEKAHRIEGWPDHEPLFVMANAPPVSASRDVDWERFEARVLARLREQRLVDDDDQIVWRRTPQGLARDFPGSRGSLYGAASNSRFSAFQRPPNKAPGVDGLYLASGSAHPGGGLPLCIQSGRQAARQLVDDHLS